MPEPSLKLIWMSPQELAENPANWRLHPETQLSALSDVISEVGWAGACLYNAVTRRLIDGHARRKVALEQGCERVPVLVGEWSEEQERKILATLDPLAAMAEADSEKLRELLAGIETESDALQAMMDELAKGAGLELEEPSGNTSEPELSTTYELVISCSGEAQQRELYERLTAEGLTCRVLSL